MVHRGFIRWPLILAMGLSTDDAQASFLADARARAALIYEQVNLTAAREFQRRRDSGAYSPSALGLEDGPPEPPSGVYEG